MNANQDLVVTLAVVVVGLVGILLMVFVLGPTLSE